MKNLEIIPLGGLEEIGKNMTVVRYEDEIYIIDAGLKFPDADMLGVDIIIPDFDYLRKNKPLIKKMLITHAHEDHIGALSHFVKEFDVPVYTTELTAAIIRNKMKNSRAFIKELHIIDENSVLKDGKCEISFFATNHSIPDSVGVVIDTPIGSVVHTGDFKVEFSPLDGKFLDFQRLGEIGKKGVLALLSDSTNAMKPGISLSETKVGENLENIISRNKGRIILATFASSLYRVQNVLNIAHKTGRKVLPLGRSMENNVKIAMKLGKIKDPFQTIISAKEMKEYSSDELLILTTGAQGEPLAGLSRMASGMHKTVTLEKGDTVIFSSSPIPGNEKSIIGLINNLLKNEVNVIDKGDIHTSGHGNQDEQKIMLSVLKPKYFVPVHGEYRMLRQHAEIAIETGVKRENVFLCENGDIIEFNEKRSGKNGRVKAEDILVDNSGLGDVDLSVMRDRKRMSTHGAAFVVADFEHMSSKRIRVKVVLKGTIAKYDKAAMNKEIATVLVDKVTDMKSLNRNRKDIYEEIGNVIFKHIRRKPMIIFEPIHLNQK